MGVFYGVFRYTAVKMQTSYCIKQVCLSGLMVLANAALAQTPKLWPYEKCGAGVSAQMADEIAQNADLSAYQTKAQAVCLECENKKAGLLPSAAAYLKQLNQTIDQTGDIPEICFLPPAFYSSDASQNNAYFECPSSGKGLKPPENTQAGAQPKNPAPPARPCINKAYVRAAAKAFNETANCFGFTSRKDKAKLFNLFSRKSGFLLTKEGKNKAQCYGQITNNDVISANFTMRYSHKYTDLRKYHHIHRNALTKCPWLTNNLIKMDACTDGGQAAPFLLSPAAKTHFQKCVHQHHSPNEFACRTSQNPHSCLFYSLYNIRKTIADVEIKLKNQLTKKIFFAPGTGSAELRYKYQLPLTANEILVAYTSPFDSSLADDKKKLTNIDQFIIERPIKLLENSRIKINFFTDDTKIKKRPIFNKDDLKWGFVYLTHRHNHGHNIVQQHFYKFMNHIRAAVKNNKAYKQTIAENGQALSLAVLEDEFKAYAQKHLPPGTGSQYDLQPPKEEINNYARLMRTGAFKNKLAHPLTRTQMTQFLNKLKDICPTGHQRNKFNYQ